MMQKLFVLHIEIHNFNTIYFFVIFGFRLFFLPNFFPSSFFGVSMVMMMMTVEIRIAAKVNSIIENEAAFLGL